MRGWGIGSVPLSVNGKSYLAYCNEFGIDAYRLDGVEPGDNGRVWRAPYTTSQTDDRSVIAAALRWMEIMLVADAHGANPRDVMACLNSPAARRP